MSAQKYTIDVGFPIEWDLEQGLNLWAGTPTLSMWIPTTVAGLMLGFQRMVGPERFTLAMQLGGLESVEGDWAIISSQPTLEEGMRLISSIAGAAGWGRWEIAELDREREQIIFRVYNSWEGIYQRSANVCIGSGMMAGKLAAIGAKILGKPCWSEQKTFTARGDAYDEFEVRPTDIKPEARLAQLIEDGHATADDLRGALDRLHQEMHERQQAEQELRVALEKAHQQEQALLRLETPILQVWEGIVAAPIMGLLTTERATDLTERLLAQVVQCEARYAILDLTGVDTVDTNTASLLVRIAGAVQLLGAKVVISGIRPAVAQTMGAIGADVSGFITKRNLRDALRYCLEANQGAKGRG